MKKSILICLWGCLALFFSCTKPGPYDGKTPDDNSLRFYFNKSQYKETVSIKYTWFGMLRNPWVSARTCDNDLVICAQVDGSVFSDSLVISVIGFHIPQSLLEEGKTIHLSGEQVCVCVSHVSFPSTPMQFFSSVKADLTLDEIGECVDHEKKYHYIIGRFLVEGLLERENGEEMAVQLDNGEIEVYYTLDGPVVFYDTYLLYYYKKYTNQ